MNFLHILDSNSHLTEPSYPTHISAHYPVQPGPQTTQDRAVSSFLRKKTEQSKDYSLISVPSPSRFLPPAKAKPPANPILLLRSTIRPAPLFPVPQVLSISISRLILVSARLFPPQQMLVWAVNVWSVCCFLSLGESNCSCEFMILSS